MIKLKKLNVVKVVDSESKAADLIRKGFVRVEEPKEIKEKPLGVMTVAELDAYAAEKGIDLTGCNNKTEKLDKIKEVEAAKEVDNGEKGGE